VAVVADVAENEKWAYTAYLPVNLWQNPRVEFLDALAVTDILGISAYYHDSAAALIADQGW
jgi:hypothetical protein